MSNTHEAQLEMTKQDTLPPPLLALLEEAFREGFASPETYNDVVENSADECWEKQRGYYSNRLAALAAQAPQQTDREAFMAGYEAAQADAARCDLPPMGWACTRQAGHEGPCAAVEDADGVELVRLGMERLREPQQAQGVAFGYVSEHNCEGPFKWQFHRELGSIYRDNCKEITPVYVAPQAAPAPHEPTKLEALKAWAKSGEPPCTNFAEGYEAARDFVAMQLACTAPAPQALTDERERLCAAIKSEDDHCVTQGDYMLDSDDCIAIIRGEWVRPEFSIDAARAASAGGEG